MASSEQIIEEVKSYQILYNMCHPEYKNIRKKNEIWDEIGKSLGAEAEEVKKKWKNLRDAYAKHIRSEKTTTGQKAKSIDRYKTWPWAQQMSFFKPYLQFANTESNVKNSEDKNDTQTEGGTQQSPIQSPTRELDEQNQPSTTATLTGKNLAKRQRIDNSQPSQQSTSFEKVLNYLRTKPSNNQDSDEIDLLFMGYAQTVKKFSKRRQTLVKYQISKMLMEQEIQQLNEDDEQ